MAPNNNWGMTYQTNEKHLTNLREYFVGVVKQHFFVITVVFYYLSLSITASNIY